MRFIWRIYLQHSTQQVVISSLELLIKPSSEEVARASNLSQKGRLVSLAWMWIKAWMFGAQSMIDILCFSYGPRAIVTKADLIIHEYRSLTQVNLSYLCTVHVRSNYGKHTFRFAITKTWEDIPTKIKTLSYHKFKKEYKKEYFQS